MLISLVKKDILLVKKYILITMIMPIVIPLLIMWRSPEFLGFVAFLTSAIFVEFMVFQYVSMAEVKYPKANALLCATPYPRRAIVVARYIFLLLGFVYCVLAYSILALISPQIMFLSLSNILTVLFILTTLLGIYAPIQYKFGFEKTKYFFTIVIVATPFWSSSLRNLGVSLDSSWLSNMPLLLWGLIMITMSILIFSVSMIASIKIYGKKEFF